MLYGAIWLWFILTFLAVAFVAIDIRSTPESPVLKWGFILVTLFMASIFSWSVMVTKFRLVRRAQRRRTQFLEAFRSDRQPILCVRASAGVNSMRPLPFLPLR